MNLELAFIKLFKWMTRIVTAADFVGYLVLIVKKIDGITPPVINLNVLLGVSFCLLIIIGILCIWSFRTTIKEFKSYYSNRKAR